MKAVSQLKALQNSYPESSFALNQNVNLTFGESTNYMRNHQLLRRLKIGIHGPKLSILSLLMLWISVYTFSQTPKTYFQSIRQGLSNQNVRCVFKDSKGFMWFGTQNGLTRYDGVNFVVYENNPTDSTSLIYNNISVIIETKNKDLWIGTYGGLCVYNRNKENFTQINLKADNVVVSSLREDNDHNIWIGTIGNGLILFNPRNKKTENFYHNNADVNSINSNHISGICLDHRNRLWIGTWNGLDLLDRKEKMIKHFVNTPNDPTSLSNDYINTLFLADNDTLWVGTLNGGLNSFAINSNSSIFKHYLNPLDNVNKKVPNILSLIGDAHHNLWVGFENDGLMRLDTRSGKSDHYMREEGNSYTLNSNTIRTLYVDDLSILWIGVNNRGLNFMDERRNRFELYKKNPNLKYTLSGEEVRSFAEDKQGNIWIATNNGICLFDVTKRQFTKSITHDKGNLSTNAITALAFDKDENLWVGTWGGGIDCFNKNLIKTGNFKIKGPQKAGENKTLSLYVDKKNTVWAGSGGSGLFRFDKLKQCFVPVFENSNPGAIGYVTSIIEDSNNNLWVGSAYRLFCLRQKGVNDYAFQNFYHDKFPKSIPSNTISVVYEDRNKNLWIGSDDKGLFLYDKKKKSFTSFRKQDGLPSNSISGILEDNKGNLWISTNKGISRFDAVNRRFRNFTTEDGLVSNEFYGNSCLTTRKGEFFFGSSEGFSMFYPENIQDNSAIQPVCLTDFKLFNKSIPVGAKDSPLSKSIGETHEIILNHKQSLFTIDFVALNYIQGSKSQYAYILEGLENEWNIVDHKNSASYSFVKPGKYSFKVKGSNNDGVWNNTPVTLEITILPPFWQTTWAYTIYLLIFIALIFSFIRYRITRAKQIHLLELNQMKLQFFANISHELRTPLSLIISPIENIMANAKGNKEINGQLELIYRNSNRLFRLVNEIMDFSKAEESKLTISVQRGDIVKFTQELSNFFSDEALRRQINYKFRAEPASIETWFDRDKYEKIILNLLSNAFKHTPDHGTISIEIEKITNGNKPLKEKKLDVQFSTNELLKISVKDNGKGISPADLNKIFERFYQGSNEDYTYQTGTGIGLSLTKTLIELHHGKIAVTSEKGKETCFTVLLPLGNNHFKKSEIIQGPIDISSKISESQFSADEDKVHNPTLSKNASTILVIEDNYDLRKYIIATLSLKYKILEAGDGETGYTLAVDNVPELIVSDIIMPNRSGIELCKQIKGNIVTSHIPIILLTAKTTFEDQISGIETGAEAYITKPFNVRYLEAVIKNLIETRQKLFKRFSQEVYILPKEITNNTLDQNFLENVIHYIEENILSTELSVENLATHLLMSRGHIWRKIKSLTGQSTNEFIRTVRLKKAIKLMEESNLNVSEIAYKVGFSSPAYFTKCFREQYGKSPSKYFSEMKKNDM